MKKAIKRTIWGLVIAFVALVAFANAIPLIIGEGNCPKPLHVVALMENPSNYTPVLTQSDFQKVVERAVAEWETKTGIDLYEVIDPNSNLARSGLANTITAHPEDITKLNIEGSFSGNAGWTEAQTRGARVERFKIEIYNTSPAVMYQVILHELGHGRGLEGHSVNENDIMFGVASYTITNLSQADVNSMVSYCKTK